MKLRNHFRTILILFAALALAGCGKDDPNALLASAKSYLAKNEDDAVIIQL